MALQIDTVTEACNAISRQIRDSYKELTLHYIVHHEGQRAEAFALAAQDIYHHPAAKSAGYILGKQQNNNEESALIGVTAANKPFLFRLANSTSLLALCAVNIDQYQSLKEMRRHAWHMAWQAIDARRVHALRDQAGHGEETKEIITRKRNALEVVMANLRADVFSTLMAALHEDPEAIQKAAIERGKNVLQPVPQTRPEYYPYIIASEATETAFQMLSKKAPTKKKLVETVLRTTDEIGKTFDITNMRQWVSFGRPAQDMAWRGYKPDEILSAAINTSEDTYVRAIGYMVSEITKIKPASILAIRENYSPFSDSTFNETLHEKTVGKIFEDVVAKGMQQNSARPLLEAADKQNSILTEGRVLGWCAGALQAAATAFDAAMHSDDEPMQAARKEFEEECAKTPWESLKELGTKIVGQYRQGSFVTLASLSKLCGNEPALAPVVKSATQTMSNPSYQKNLEAVRELITRPAVDQAPKLAARTPQPSQTPQPATPGMGGGGAMQRTSTNVSPAQKDNDVQEDKEEDNTEQ